MSGVGCNTLVILLLTASPAEPLGCAGVLQPTNLHPCRSDFRTCKVASVRWACAVQAICSMVLQCCKSGICQLLHMGWVYFLQITAYAGLISSFGSDVSLYTSGDYVTNSSCPTDSTAGGILGPSVGKLTATANMDPSFYGWVGCNCSSASRERVYNIATSGDAQSTLPRPVPTISAISVMHKCCSAPECRILPILDSVSLWVGPCLFIYVSRALVHGAICRSSMQASSWLQSMSYDLGTSNTVCAKSAS